MEIIFAICISIVVPMIAGLILDWFWPRASRRRLVLVSALILPAVLIVLIIVGFFYFMGEDCPPNVVCDAGAMAAAAILYLGSMWLVISLVIGLVAASLTMNYLRKP